MTNCIFFLADGARADVFSELLTSGQLPNISRHIVDSGTYTSATTVFPSTTGPAYAPFIVGRFPGRCNLPGIRWFDRGRYSSKLFSLHRMRSYIGLEGFLMKDDLSSDSQTLFELLPKTANYMNELSRGAGLKGNKTIFWSAWYKFKAHYDYTWDKVDLFVRELLLKNLAELPMFSFCVFMGIDHFSHLYHPFHQKVIASYKRLDETVGLVAKRLKELGAYDDTLLILSSDHGLTPTHTHFDSVEFMDNQGYKTLHYPKVYKLWQGATAANMISGNGMTHLYIKSPDGWSRRSHFEELTGLADALLDRKEVDIVAGLDAEGRTRIKSQRGEALAWFDDDDNVNYERLNGDPLGYNGGYNGIPSVMDVDTALEKSFDSRYPDGIVQLIQLFESERTGDLVVSANEGYDLRARYESPEHHSSHGALFREHMLVPFAINKKIERKYVRTVDVYPTVLDFLGVAGNGGVDGKSLLAKP